MNQVTTTAMQLPDNFNDLTPAQQAAIMGIKPAGSGLAYLKINSEAENDAGQRLPVGEFYIDTDNGRAYSKSVTFKPILRTFMYQRYDAGQNKYVNKTIQVKDLRGAELPDEQGTVRCGRRKLRDGEYEAMSEAEKKEYSQVKCSQIIYGRVVFTGKTEDGSTIEVDTPAAYQAGGQSYTPVDNAFRTLNSKRKQFFQYDLTLEVEGYKNEAGKRCYRAAAKFANLTQQHTIDVELFRVAQEHIDYVNAQVMTKYRKAINGSAADHAAEVLDSIGDEYETELDDDFADERRDVTMAG